jgi:O-antigen/teichoic acid export membrane protein
MDTKLIRNNLAANAIIQVLAVGFPIILQSYLVRHLYIEDLGHLNIINATKSISMLSISFLNLYLVKVVSNSSDDEVASYIVNSTALMLLLLTIPVTFFLIYLLYNYPNLSHIIFITVLTMIIAPLSCDFYFQAKLKNTFSLYRRLVVWILYLICLFAFVNERSDFLFYVYISSFATIIEVLMNFYYIKKYFNINFLSKKLIKSILYNSIGLLPFLLTFNLLPNLFMLVGSKFMQINDFTIFGILFKLINLATTFVTSAVMILFPAKIIHKKMNSDKLYDDLKYLRNTIIVCFLIILSLLLFRNIIFNVFLYKYKISNMNSEFFILSFYIIIHSIYNYVAFNYYLINGYNNILVIINIFILLIFSLELYLIYFLKFHIYMSFVVTMPPLLGLIILIFHSIIKLRVNYINLFLNKI